MPQDIHGLMISTSSAKAAVEFDRAVLAYLKFRVDAPELLSSVLNTDPEFGLAHCLKGYFAMLTYNQAKLPMAVEAARIARVCSARATTREKAHVEALDAWISGDLDRMLAIWEAILADHPTDILALRLGHLNNFWLGRPRDMAASIERVLPKWGYNLPGYGTVLSCRSFALEECGEYATAEPVGRQAVEIDPADFWGTHAVAHIMEMQGRHDEGIFWLQTLEPHWKSGSNLVHHLWWHRALFHLERGEFDEVLGLYDRRFRDLASKLTQAQPDLYIDVQNAASTLFRLERLGVDVGNRWTEIADKAEQRIGDCLSAFTLPHWMMALTAAGRDLAAKRLLDEMGAFGRTSGTVAQIVSRVAVPICEAVIAHRRGDYVGTIALMKPQLPDMDQLGGSHAQQDVLEQLFLDAALKAGLVEDIRLLLGRVAARHPVSPHRRIGYSEAARQYLN